MSESNRPLDDDGFLLAREPEEEARPDDRIDDERMDEENTLKPEFVRSVEDALDEGDVKAVYELVDAYSRRRRRVLKSRGTDADE